MFALWLTLLGTATAEPPMVVPLKTAVAESQLIFVGKPVRVQFQTLKPGETMPWNSLNAYWVEYKIESVIRGESKVGDTVRVEFDSGGCIMEELEIRREGDRFIEKSPYAERELDPAGWLPDSSFVVSTQRHANGLLWNHGFGSSPQPATAEHVAHVRKLAEKRPKR